ncbi:MAG: sigma-70 family RNA polymerase sigma factor [Anaerolineae bacterium]
MDTLLLLTQYTRGAANCMQNLDERALARLRADDAQAIGAIYDTYFPEIYRYVRYRLNDAHAAEDLASEVFLRFLEAVRKRRGPQTNLRSWLISTAAHVVTDHMRRSYRRPTEDLPDDVLDHASGPIEEFDRREQNRRFQTAYAQLTAEQQHVLALRFGQGYSLEQTAAVMQKNVNAVKALQFRALSALQRCLGEVIHG